MTGGNKTGKVFPVREVKKLLTRDQVEPDPIRLDHHGGSRKK